ncbi:MAG: serine hydrolase [Flavimaricola sp.]|nr:serine hydrolase [Flavimaricola sp.]
MKPTLPGRLEALVPALAPPYAFCGVGLALGDAVPQYHIATAPGISATPNTLFRAASISKIVTARTLDRVARSAGLGSEFLNDDIGSHLGFRLRNPRWPDRPITIGQVASHSSGLCDDAGYSLPAGQPIAEWFEEVGSGCFLPHPPGTFFTYANLGYLLLAAVCEAIGTKPFDTLARQHVLDPLGIEGGFNWSGVPAPRREDRLATYRQDNGALVPQIDSAVTREGISDPEGNPALRAPYQLHLDVTRLSPQGGMRLSLQGALALARSLANEPAQRLWTPSMGPGDYSNGIFESYGMGLQILDNPAFYPRPLIGHFGNAYGFLGGVWYDRKKNAGFAYALNGAPIDAPDDRLMAEEQALFAAIGAHVDKG